VGVGVGVGGCGYELIKPTPSNSHPQEEIEKQRKGD
jgi:hypothetical protein